MMLAKIEREQKNNIMLNKSKLKDLTNEEREIQKKSREVAREERDRGKRVKIGYRKIHINGEWFIWDGERGETEENFLEEGEKKRR
jgi:hypothetical protein